MWKYLSTRKMQRYNQLQVQYPLGNIGCSGLSSTISELQDGLTKPLEHLTKDTKVPALYHLPYTTNDYYATANLPLENLHLMPQLVACEPFLAVSPYQDKETLQLLHADERYHLYATPSVSPPVPDPKDLQAQNVMLTEYPGPPAFQTPKFDNSYITGLSHLHQKNLSFHKQSHPLLPWSQLTLPGLLLSQAIIITWASCHPKRVKRFVVSLASVQTV